MLSRLKWLELDYPTRAKIVELFQVPRSGHTLVENQTVQSDGHTDKDLEYITIEKMQKFTDSFETDFYQLFTKVIFKIQYPDFKPSNANYVEETKTSEQNEGSIDSRGIEQSGGTKTKRRGRPPKAKN